MSGSGKTTLLNLIGGLDYPDSGTVIIDGENLHGMTEDQMTIFRRRKIGFILQQYNLISVYNVYQNIVLPIRLDGEKPMSFSSRVLLKNWVCRICKSASQVSYPEASSKEWQLPGQPSPGRPLFWQMSQQGIWIPGPPPRSWSYLRI